MLPDIVLDPLRAVVGVAYPMYNSYKALNGGDQEEVQRMLAFWVCHGSVLLAENATDLLLSWLPFYKEAKLVLLIALQYNNYQVSVDVYRAVVKPRLDRNEREIDAAIDHAHSNVHQASVRAYQQLLNIARDVVTDVWRGAATGGAAAASGAVPPTSERQPAPPVQAAAIATPQPQSPPPQELPPAQHPQQQQQPAQQQQVPAATIAADIAQAAVSTFTSFITVAASSIAAGQAAPATPAPAAMPAPAARTPAPSASASVESSGFVRVELEDTELRRRPLAGARNDPQHISETFVVRTPPAQQPQRENAVAPVSGTGTAAAAAAAAPAPGNPAQTRTYWLF